MYVLVQRGFIHAIPTFCCLFDLIICYILNAKLKHREPLHPSAHKHYLPMNIKLLDMNIDFICVYR